MNTFHVVTQRRWMVEELRSGLEPFGWQVVGHHGLSALPPQVGINPDHVLWAPQAFAARMLASGVPLRLSTPGPGWLPSLCEVDMTREVELLTVAQAKDEPRAGFWKLAEAKWDRFPAQWRSVPELRSDSPGTPERWGGCRSRSWLEERSGWVRCPKMAWEGRVGVTRPGCACTGQKHKDVPNAGPMSVPDAKMWRKD